MKTEVDNSRPLTFGAPRQMDVFFNRNAGFRHAGDGASLVRYPQQVSVSSGWAIGSDRLAKPTPYWIWSTARAGSSSWAPTW